MKPSLQIKLGHQLTMTPQLQQAIRLLQLSSLDLQVEIRAALDANPLLEAPDESDSLSPVVSDMRESEQPHTEMSQLDLQYDAPWTNTPTSHNHTKNNDDDSSDFIKHSSIPMTLQAHLYNQLRLNHMSITDQAIAASLIDAISDDGYLRCDINDIQMALKPDIDVDEDEILAVLHGIQQLDPVGVGARDLRECLLTQMSHLPSDTPCLQEAQKMIAEYFELLGQRQLSTLMKKIQIDKETLDHCIALIQSLNPRPGAHIVSSQAEYVIPDVLVRKINGHWVVTLNAEAIPKLRINRHYAGMIKRADTGGDNHYLKTQLQEARWLLKSLESRNETLLKVATCIVESQRAFLEYGEEAMRPMVLHDVAQAIDMHESTVSRVTTQKFMHTPKGIFELKYFFSSHVHTQAGGECSSVAIRALIKKLIAQESAAKPLSDNKIAKLLQDQGINVARRTVAKYREALHIPASNERKRL